MNIKKGDLVEVIAGDEKGKRGKVLRVMPDKNAALVEKVNIVKRHVKPTQQSQGGIVDKEARLNLSNLGVVCDNCDRPVRVAKKILDDDRKVRACAKCGEVFDK